MLRYLIYLLTIAAAAFAIGFGARLYVDAAPAAELHHRPRVVMTIYKDNGGVFMQYFNNIQREQREGFFYAIKGRCASACTMRLDASCVYPEAQVFFHSPYVDANEMPDDVSADTANASVNVMREVMMATYPEAIQAWAEHFDALGSVHMTVLRFDELRALGIRDCRQVLKQWG